MLLQSRQGGALRVWGVIPPLFPWTVGGCWLGFSCLYSVQNWRILLMSIRIQNFVGVVGWQMVFSSFEAA